MLRYWQQLLRNAYEIKIILNRLWTKQTTQQHNFKIYTLFFMTGVGLQVWLVPYLQERQEKNAQSVNVQAVESRHRSMGPNSHRGTFRDVTIKEYENRLRAHSQPEKIFGYFATIMAQNHAGQWEVLMTPVDFVRSMLPGIRQPEGLGLNKYRKMSRNQLAELKFKSVPKDSIFYQLRPDGLLTFTEFLYLCMLMPLPEKFFEIGFYIFDTMENESLTINGFNQLLHGVTKYERIKTSNSINHYFFGPKLNGKLSLNTFLKFRRKFILDALMIEFNMLRSSDASRKCKRSDPETICEVSFANLLLAYSTMPRIMKIETIRRINRKYGKSKRGVTLEEFMAFFKFVQHIPTIDMALTFHFLAGADISRSTLKHISDIVVGVSLSNHIIDIIFTVFDTDENGILGRSEFLQAVRQRMVNKGRTKFSDVLDIIQRCALRTLIP